MSKITFLKEIKYSYQSCLLLKIRDIHGTTAAAPQATRSRGKQKFRRKDFGSRLLAAEGEGG